MRFRKTIVAAVVVTLAIVGTSLTPPSNAGDCLVCEFAGVPDPDTGEITIYHICLDFGDYYGWEQCWECVNCNSCFMAWKCTWNTDPG